MAQSTSVAEATQTAHRSRSRDKEFIEWGLSGHWNHFGPERTSCAQM